MTTAYDADVLVLGAGPNGLTAAAMLAGAGLDVIVLEAADAVGGAVRTDEVTLPGYRHDTFSGFYPFSRVGPISALPLERYGLEWANFDRPYGGGTPTGVGFALERTLPATRQAIQKRQPADLPGWDELWRAWQRLGPGLLDLLFHPLGDLPPLLKLGLRFLPLGSAFALQQLLAAPARSIAERLFQSEDARVWFIGSARHSDLLPEALGGAMLALVLGGLAQDVGMPIPRGGAQAIPDALRRCLEDRGGRVHTGARVEHVLTHRGRAVGAHTAAGDVYARRAVLSTIEPQQLFLRLLDERLLPEEFVRAVRQFEWGVGTFRLDCALSALPTFRVEALNGVGVLHLGESTDSLSLTASQAHSGLLPDHPFMIVGLHTLADPSRAPAGGHTLWIESHAPAHIRGDALGRITTTDWARARESFADRLLEEMDRYAPGVRTLILARQARSPLDLAHANANLVHGDIAGGSMSLHQQLVFRPVPGWFRHRTPVPGLYLGGASTHPGAGVHGACGANAARVLLGDLGRARRARW